MDYEKTSPCLSCVHGSMCPNRSTYETLLAHSDDIMCRISGTSEEDGSQPNGLVKMIVSHRIKDGPELDRIYQKTFGKFNGTIHGCKSWTGENCHCRRWYAHAGSMPHGSILFRELNPAVPAYCAQVDHPGAMAWSMLNWKPVCDQCKLKYADDAKSLAASLGGTGFAEFYSATYEVPIGYKVDPYRCYYQADQVPAGYVKAEGQEEVMITENYQTVVVLWEYKPSKSDPGEHPKPDPVPAPEEYPTLQEMVEKGINHTLYVYTMQDVFFGDGLTPNTIKMDYIQAKSGQYVRYEKDVTAGIVVGQPIPFGAPILGYTTRKADPNSFFGGKFDEPNWCAHNFTPKDGDTGVAYSLYEKDSCSLELAVPPGYRLATERLATANPAYCEERNSLWTTKFRIYRKKATINKTDPGIVSQPIDGAHNDALGVGGTMEQNWYWHYTIEFEMGKEDIFLPLYLKVDGVECPDSGRIEYRDLVKNNVRQVTVEEFPIRTDEKESVWNAVIPTMAPTYPQLEETDLNEYFFRPYMKKIGVAPLDKAHDYTLEDMGLMSTETRKVYSSYPDWIGESDAPTVNFQKMLYEFDVEGFYHELYWALDAMDGAYDLSPEKRIPIQLGELGIMPIEDDGIHKAPDFVSRPIWLNMPYQGTQEPIQMLTDYLNGIFAMFTSEQLYVTLYLFDQVVDSETKALLNFPVDFDMLPNQDAAYIGFDGEEPMSKSLRDFIIYDSANGFLDDGYLNYQNRNMVIAVTMRHRAGIVGRPNYAIIPLRADFPPKKLDLEVSVFELPKEGEMPESINDIRVSGIGEVDSGKIEVSYDTDLQQFVITGHNACFYEVGNVTYVQEARCSVMYFNADKHSTCIYSEELLLPVHQATVMKLNIPEFATVRKISISDKKGTAVPYIKPGDSEPATPNFIIGSGVVKVAEGEQGIPWDIYFNVEDLISIFVYVSEFNDDPAKHCARCKGYIKTKQYSDWLTWVPDCKDYQPAT